MQVVDFTVRSNEPLNDQNHLLKVTPVGDEKLPEMYPGQFVRVAVIVEERTDAMLVPEEAVMSQGEQRLLSLVEQGKVRRQVVQLGLRRDGWVEVREGLRGDEQVIRSGWHKVFPGDPVRVRSAAAQAARP